MKTVIRRALALVLLMAVALPAFPTAYNARPKLVVIIIVDQLRGDLLERVHDQLGPSGFRMFLERGAYFTDCYYDYATTFTAPGHATLFTGGYPSSHGILANDWWDAARKRIVTSVADDHTMLVGASGEGASPHNLLSTTLGDELKLATGGRSRVFAISLKDRSAVLPGGFGADGAYWTDHTTGAFITSTFYMKAAPSWVVTFNSSRPAKYWNLEWKDESGAVLRRTAQTPGPGGQPAEFYSVVGKTPFANDYEFEFARELVTQEKLGSGPTTDLLAISLSANDILGHEVGPDSPQLMAMILAMDKQFAGFFDFLGREIGLANVWVALSADHGVAPTSAVAHQFRIPTALMSPAETQQKLNSSLAAKLGIAAAKADIIRSIEWPVVFVNDASFGQMGEAAAERMVGEALKEAGASVYFTRSQLAAGEVPDTETGRQFLHSYSPYGGWWVFAQTPAFTLPSREGTTHGSLYNYDTHVPLAFFGLPFRAGLFRNHAEPIDLAPTLSSLLGINPPSGATGRVLTEALQPPGGQQGPGPR